MRVHGISRVRQAFYIQGGSVKSILRAVHQGTYPIVRSLKRHGL